MLKQTALRFYLCIACFGVRSPRWERIERNGEGSKCCSFEVLVRYGTAELLSEGYITGCAMENTFWRTLCMNTAYSVVNPGGSAKTRWAVLRGTEVKAYKKYDSCWELVQWCVEKSGSEPIDAALVTQEVVDFDKLGIRSTCRRQFFIPEKGYCTWV